MAVESPKAELARGASWRAVRSGLLVLALAWLVVTLLSVFVQVLASGFAPAAASGDQAAVFQIVVLSRLYQGAYALFAVAFVFGVLRLTRVPPETRAMNPALAAAAGFAMVVLLTVVVALAKDETDPTRSLSSQAGLEMRVMLVIARAVAVIFLVLALLRIAAAREVGLHAAHAASLFALAAVDTLYPLYRLFTPSDPTQIGALRPALIAIQLLLALALVHLALRARRAIPPGFDQELSAAAARKRKKKRRKQAQAADAVGETEAGEPADRAAPLTPRAVEPKTAVAPATTLVAAALAGGALGLLPLWDALRGAGIADSAHAYASSGKPLLFVAGAILAMFVLHGSLKASPYGARGVFLVVALTAMTYSVLSVYDLALDRSRTVDTWPVCESSFDVRGNPIDPDEIKRGNYAGPKLADGTPCSRASERRDVHVETEPNGSFRDGVVQIGIRFVDDRARVIGGTVTVMLLLLVSGVLVVRSARAVD